jgi:hypothetical protein
VHSDGSYEGISQSIEAGVSADKSTIGVAMPPKGGSDEQLRAVAAYVWSLSQPSKLGGLHHGACPSSPTARQTPPGIIGDRSCVLNRDR